MSQRGNKKTTLLLIGLAVGMFGFAFALVPLYNVICEITGINGKTSAQAELIEEIESSTTPTGREINIQFLAKSARGMPWVFRPMQEQMVVRTGEMNTTTFYVRNRAQKSVTGQAVPSVSPGLAALYLKKVECFCFEQQELSAGAEMEMGVSFYVANDLPTDVNEFTLSYTMFNISDPESQLVGHHE